MDARIDPASAYGITLGDAHVIRNAGASARDALRSLVISEQLLGTQEILLFKHTGCGMLTFTNEVAEGLVKKNLGEEALKETAQFKGDFLTFPELEAAIKDDVKYLKESKLIPDNIVISGWVHDVEHGTVTNVV
jgi:carbonic anhydrase